MSSPRTIESSDDDAADERLDVGQLGLQPGQPWPLRMRPAASWSPLVISFPHVGLAWPAALGAAPEVDFARNADYAVGHIYGDANALGAATVEAVYSRLLVDLNRASDDISPRVVPDHPAPRPRRRPGVLSTDRDPDDIDHSRPGRGVVWSSALGNVPLLQRPLEFAAFRERIEQFHEPYYRALEQLLEHRRRRFGFAILLDAHSMPCSVGTDLVLGTLGGSSCDASIQQLALDALAGSEGGAKLRLRLNDPYHGGELVRRFGRPADGVHALQLEVSRSLYMDERTLTLWSDRPEPSARAQQDADAEADDAGRSGSWHGASGAPIAYPGPNPAPERSGHQARSALPPSPRHAADFTELRGRVSCLVRRLAQRDHELAPSGTSLATARATDPRAPHARAGVRSP